METTGSGISIHVTNGELCVGRIELVVTVSALSLPCLVSASVFEDREVESATHSLQLVIVLSSQVGSAKFSVALRDFW